MMEHNDHLSSKLKLLQKANDRIITRITLLHELIAAEEKKLRENFKTEAFLKTPRAFFSK